MPRAAAPGNPWQPYGWCNGGHVSGSQKTQEVGTMLDKCWASVTDAGQTLHQHCVLIVF